MPQKCDRADLKGANCEPRRPTGNPAARFQSHLNPRWRRKPRSRQVRIEAVRLKFEPDKKFHRPTNQLAQQTRGREPVTSSARGLTAWMPRTSSSTPTALGASSESETSCKCSSTASSKSLVSSQHVSLPVEPRPRVLLGRSYTTVPGLKRSESPAVVRISLFPWRCCLAKLSRTGAFRATRRVGCA